MKKSSAPHTYLCTRIFAQTSVPDNWEWVEPIFWSHSNHCHTNPCMYTVEIVSSLTEVEETGCDSDWTDKLIISGFTPTFFECSKRSRVSACVRIENERLLFEIRNMFLDLSSSAGCIILVIYLGVFSLPLPAHYQAPNIEMSLGVKGNGKMGFVNHNIE